MAVLNSRLEMLLDAVNGRVRASDRDAGEGGDHDGDGGADLPVEIAGADAQETSALRQLLHTLTQYLGPGGR
jgi:hypothetical protein